MTELMRFPFMDTIAGKVTEYNRGSGVFTLETIDGRRFDVRLSDGMSAEMLRNLDEPVSDAGGHVDDLLSPGRQLFAYGVFYPEGGGYTYEAKRLVFLGRDAEGYNFEKADWWINQIDSLARFYRKAQFGTGP